MAKIEGKLREVCAATEFLAIVTSGEDGPHVVGNWGSYMRAMGIDGEQILLPAGGYKKTERNLQRNDRIQVLIASKTVQGSRSPGQAYLIKGRAKVAASGQAAEAVRAKFPWARGALIIQVEEAIAQL